MDARIVGRRPRRVMVWSIAGVVLVTVAAGALFVARNAGGNGGERKNKKEEAAPASPVEIATVREGRIASFLETTATLEALNAADLVAQRAGQVRTLSVEEGAFVRKGDLLARLDDTEQRLNVERTQLAWEVAKRELERGQQLEAQSYLSRKALDDLELAVRNAWVALEQARFELSQTRIEAPFAGRVVERSISLGEHVTVGRTCFRIADFHPLRARLYFPERELGRVRIGQSADLTLDTHPGEVLRARVALVNPVVDRANGTFKVTLELPNAEAGLRPGAFARVRLETGRQDNALLMPRRGVLTEDGDAFVFVARGDSVERIAVTVGAVEHDTAQILSGLSPGDSVVTVGQGGLKPGSKIKPVTL
jgi:membrane fusion protein (multidrug efflux system)